MKLILCEAVCLALVAWSCIPLQYLVSAQSQSHGAVTGGLRTSPRKVANKGAFLAHQVSLVFPLG